MNSWFKQLCLLWNYFASFVQHRCALREGSMFPGRATDLGSGVLALGSDEVP